MKILVTGATGTMGQEVVKVISEAGLPLTAATRNKEQVRCSSNGTEGNVVYLDYEKPSSFRPALQGISHVLLIIPPGAKEADAYLQFVQAAEIMQVQHITLLSGRTTGDLKGRPLAQLEKALEKSELNHTIFRLGWFMQNFATWLAADIRDRGEIALPAGDQPIAFVDIRDAAKAITKSFTEPSLRSQLYELVGPEALTHQEVAQLFTEILDRPVKFEDLSPVDYLSNVLKRGENKETAVFNVFLYDLVKTGKEASLTKDLERIIGHPPTPFRQFIKDYRTVWE
jgi:uncharacterized protein YbjT (DUF2867 family)